MLGLTCNACNTDFENESQQKLHYKSEWHRYNLKRKVAGVPGVTEALFLDRQSALDQEQNKLNEVPMLYSCALCGKAYRSSNAYDQHLKSRTHFVRASQGNVDPQSEEIAVIKPAQAKEAENVESDGSGDEWEEVDPDEDMDVDKEVDPSCCFICDLEHSTIETCMVHMHQQHGFFIPDVEYLKDPTGLLIYLGLKVKKDFMCLYCNDQCQPFSSLEAVRKHMEAKSHCKIRFGEGGDDEEADLEEFYDYSSSYVDADGKQLVTPNDMPNTAELGSGGSELVIKREKKSGTLIKTLGSREFLRYYRQKPRPSPTSEIALTATLASRYRSMGLVKEQSVEHILRKKALREMNRSGVDAMRSKIGMKSNVIRNLPRNSFW